MILIYVPRSQLTCVVFHQCQVYSRRGADQTTSGQRFPCNCQCLCTQCLTFHVQQKTFAQSNCSPQGTRTASTYHQLGEHWYKYIDAHQQRTKANG